MNRTIALSTGPDTHLDHLAPICAQLDIPLITTEYEHLEIAKTFYPMVDVQYVPIHKLTLEMIASNFDTLIGCGKFWGIELKPLIKMFFQKDLRIVFAPHGNSDKEALLGKPVKQDTHLVYGRQMKEETSGDRVIEMGNIRLWFYEKHKAHFDALANGAIFSSCDPKKKNVLYAPTWNTTATTSSFFSHADKVVGELKDKVNLLIKLHPLLEENNPALYHRFLGKYERDAIIIESFPAIYPILEKVDIYLGDTSSIGYDFLYFNRPMFFLEGAGELQSCGTSYEGPASLENDQSTLREVRQNLYERAFSESGENIDLG